MGVCSLSQVVVARLLERWGDGGVAAHLQRLRTLYRSRCDALCAALRAHPECVAFTRPEGGMFVWVRLVGCADADAVAKTLLSEGIKVVPGRLFRADGAPCPYLRLTFCNEPEDILTRAAHTLCSRVSETRAHSHPRSAH